MKVLSSDMAALNSRALCEGCFEFCERCCSGKRVSRESSLKVFEILLIVGSTIHCISEPRVYGRESSTPDISIAANGNMSTLHQCYKT